jgi:hypothetical protein
MSLQPKEPIQKIIVMEKTLNHQSRRQAGSWVSQKLLDSDVHTLDIFIPFFCFSMCVGFCIKWLMICWTRVVIFGITGDFLF